MRIGIDYTAGLSQTAGIGRYTRGLVGGLARIDSHNEYVLFHAKSSTKMANPALADASNFHMCGCPLSARALAIMWHRLKLPLPVNFYTGPLDMFHAPDYALPPTRRAAKVVTVHDLSFLLYPECAANGLRKFLEKVVPVSTAKADVVLVDSVNTRDDLVCLLDVPPSKIEVVYPGVDDHFHPLKNDPRLAAFKEHWALDRPFILNVGTLEPRKNQVRLIQAYAMLKERRKIPHQLVIVGGRGWLFEDIFRCVNELGLNADVRFLGYASDEDLPLLYNLADIFAFPSLYEGFGLPLLEAMACGTPVISSSSSSLPEVVGDAALQVRTGDADALAAAIERVLDDSALRSELSAKGLERAKLFSWEAAARQVLRVYERF